MQMPEAHIPSSLPALSECPCFKSGPGSEAAERGTLQHKALEEMLKTGSSSFNQLDEDEIGNVKYAYEEIKQWTQGEKIESEQYLEYLNPDFSVRFFGTADVICGSHLFDYKSGEQHNYWPQLAAYVMMMGQRDPKIKEVTCHLVYGKLRMSDNFTITVDEATKKVNKILEAKASPFRRASLCDYCKWCAVASICPTLNNVANMVVAAREDFQLENYHSSEITTGAGMAKALRMARFLKTWCESVEHHAKEMAIKRGEEIPGFVVAKRSGKRFISDVVKAEELSGIPTAEFLSMCSIGIGDLEKKLGKAKCATLLEPVICKTADTVFLTEVKEEKPKEGW